MNYWIVKQEPQSYAWDDFVNDGKTDWTGVRNFQARNNLREMKVGDKVLFYHSSTGKEVVGVAAVTRAAFPDPTDEKWTAVELTPVKALKKPVGLYDLKQNPALANLGLLRQSQLSVIAIERSEYDEILRMAK